MARTYNYSDPDTDVRVLITQITDSIKDDTTVTYFITKADDFIDSKLGRLYSVPFTTTPPLVKHISASLAAYSTLRSIKLTTTEEQENWINLYKTEALEMLMGVMNGDSNLYDANGVLISPSKDRGITSTTEDYRPIFNEGDALDWNISNQKMMDEEGEFGNS